MNENAKKWVETLKSGDYKQATGYLQTPDGFCCLGVACDLYAEETGDGAWSEAGDYYQFVVDEGRQLQIATLPTAVREWLGLRTEAGDIDNENALTALNDAGVSFDQIAEQISREPEGLFLS